ncbi:MAG: hypothetical protein FJ125_18670, partial [Deltaproteobacteria bacterium]|nr:hypothetical protein [Deltaproteobacteria bacterium]
MSEYQYYEFQAIDRPLTVKETAELRSYSTRARITPTSFVNDYSWGSFKGDADVWMERYFDAHLYLANWGTRVLKLRLPSRVLDLPEAQPYCPGAPASVRVKDGKVILSWTSEDEDDGEWVEGEGWLSSLISVRAELARGDLRALYLGWLLAAQGGELDDEDEEPPVPPGLGQLTASLDGFVEFLRIDEDLLAVAAESSPPLEERTPNLPEIRQWVAALPAGEKDDLLARLIGGEDSALASLLLRRFLEARDRRSGREADQAQRRSVGELLGAAEEHAAERRRVAARKAAEEKARREREAAAAHARHLDSLTGREPKLWSEAETLIATKQPKSYDRAVELLVDLRDLAAREQKADEFRLRIHALRAEHQRKPSLIERLRRA